MINPKMSIKKDKLPRNELVKLLKNMLIEVGVVNMSFTDIAAETGWTRQTVSKDTYSLIDNIDPKDIARCAAKSFLSLEGLEKRYNLLIRATVGMLHEHRAALDGKRRFEETKIKVLEAYGYKDKVADKVDVNWKEEIKKLVKPAKLKWGEGGFRPADEK